MAGIGANTGGLQEIVLQQAPNANANGGYSGGTAIEGAAFTSTFYTQWINIQMALFAIVAFELGTVTGNSPSLTLQAYTRSAMGGTGVVTAIPLYYPETQNTIISPSLVYSNSVWGTSFRAWCHDIQWVATIATAGSPSFTVKKFRMFIKNEPR